MRTLLLVHAHPDDEAILTGGAMLRAHRAGIRVVNVTCTRGEEGEIHNLDEAATRPRLAQVRTEELRRAGEILGVDRQEFLGYRDSGMLGTPANDHPASFHRAGLAEAAGRLAAILREERPDVVLTYGPDGLYRHPDHVKAHLVTHAACDLVEGEGIRPRVYHGVMPREPMREFARSMAAAGLPSPFGEDSTIDGVPMAEVAVSLDCRDEIGAKRLAFAAHVSQNDPSSFFLNMPEENFDRFFGREFYQLGRGEAPAGLQSDLFAGLEPGPAG